MYKRRKKKLLVMHSSIYLECSVSNGYWDPDDLLMSREFFRSDLFGVVVIWAPRPSYFLLEESTFRE